MSGQLIEFVLYRIGGNDLDVGVHYRGRVCARDHAMPWVGLEQFRQKIV
jgi:hypothetical protein